MQSITTFIIDDEFQSRNFLRAMLQQYFPEIIVLGEASSVEQGLEGINKYKPHIVFLDIQLKEETGFDLLNRLPKIDFGLIFVTAYNQYALKAFRFNAIDYLLKPIIPEELIEAVNKVKQRIGSTKTDSKKLVDQLYKDIQDPK
ncbi:MAG: response regulator, partial [Ferruginibacter sp.]